MLTDDPIDDGMIARSSQANYPYFLINFHKNTLGINLGEKVMICNSQASTIQESATTYELRYIL